MLLLLLQGFIDYWRLSYDWRKWEGVLNSMAQFSATIRGIQLHFVWEKSDNPDAIPLLLLHGWPGSYFEVCALGVIGLGGGGRRQNAAAAAECLSVAAAARLARQLL
jgi:pimeloyl-ACP methyl ester carboxylesterase